MHWLWVIIIGFIAGAIAKLFIAGPGGFIVTTLLGIVGAIFATWLGQQIGWYRPGQGAGFIGAIVGAVLILAIDRAIIGGHPRAPARRNRPAAIARPSEHIAII